MHRVTLSGQLRRPGGRYTATYTVRDGESVLSIIDPAGKATISPLAECMTDVFISIFRPLRDELDPPCQDDIKVTPA